MIEELQPIAKLPLERLEFRELKVYIFIGRSENIQVAKEGVHLIFSYDKEVASIAAKQSMPVGFFLKYISAVSVKKLLEQVEAERNITLEKLEEKPIEKKTTKEQFFYNLKLAADEFPKELKDFIKQWKPKN